MYLLDFLAGFPGVKPEDVVSFEYRLLCSGTLYNGRVVTADWSKSDATRFLCRDPIWLFVASARVDAFPQELALRFETPRVTETESKSSIKSSISFHPDDEITRDLSAILSVLCRRLITVAAKVRETHDGDRDWPIGFVRSLARVHWRAMPSSVVWRLDKIEEIIDYNPAPSGVDVERVRLVLTRLPSLPQAEPLILAARLYALALAQIHEDVDVAYLLLVAAVESLADAVREDYRPNEDEQVKVKQSVAKLALGFGLNEEQARALALEACKGIPWAKRKFRGFLATYCTEDLWTADDLFRLEPAFAPPREQFEVALGQIYDARSSLTHDGEPFPIAAAIGLGGKVPARAMLGGLPPSFPPIAWFERVVNNAMNGLIDRSIEALAKREPDPS